MTLLMIISRSTAVGFGEICQFPTNNPIQDLEAGETFQTQILDHNRVYTYSDNFGSCHGCVKSIKFCYRPSSNVESKELMTIELRNIGNNPTDTYTVFVNTTQDRANCQERYSLHFTDCCVEQILTEPLAVINPQWHYALKIYNPFSSLLRHQTETVNGQQNDIVDGAPTQFPSYKPLFYFVIDPSDSKS